MTRGDQLIADARRPPVLPHDGVMDWLAGGTVPDDRRFALVGNANGGDITGA